MRVYARCRVAAWGSIAAAMGVTMRSVCRARRRPTRWPFRSHGPPTGSAARAAGSSTRSSAAGSGGSRERRPSRRVGDAVLLHLDGQLELRAPSQSDRRPGSVDLDAFARRAQPRHMHSPRGRTLVLAARRDPAAAVGGPGRGAGRGTILAGSRPVAGRRTTRPPRARADRGRPRRRSQELRDAAERAAFIAERRIARATSANMPPNELNPHTLGEHAKELAASTST